MHHDQTHTVTFSSIEHSVGDDRSAALATNVDSLQMDKRMVKLQLKHVHTGGPGIPHTNPGFWSSLRF